MGTYTETQQTRQRVADLVSRYSDQLVRFAYGYVKNAAAAEDITADVFAALFVKGKGFGEDQAVRGYLYKAVRSRCIDYLRRHRREVPLEDLENVLSCSGPEDWAHRRERNETLYICIQQLPSQYREVILLTYFAGFSLEQVARTLHKTMRQVYNLHSRSKTALKELLQKEGISNEDLW